MNYSLRAGKARRRQRSPSPDFELPTQDSSSSSSSVSPPNQIYSTRSSTPFSLRSKRARSVNLPEPLKGKESQTTWTKSGKRCQGPMRKSALSSQRRSERVSARSPSKEGSSSASPAPVMKTEHPMEAALNSDGDIVVPPPSRKKRSKLTSFLGVEVEIKKETSMAATDSSYVPDIRVGTASKLKPFATNSTTGTSNAIASGSGSGSTTGSNTMADINTRNVKDLTEAEILANLSALLSLPLPPLPPLPPPPHSPLPSNSTDFADETSSPQAPTFPTAPLTQISTLLHSLSPFSHLASYAPNFFRIGVTNGDDLLKVIEFGLKENKESDWIMRALEEEGVPAFERICFWRAVRRKREEVMKVEGGGNGDDEEDKKAEDVEEKPDGMGGSGSASGSAIGSGRGCVADEGPVE